MKITISVLTIVSAIMFAGSVMAVPPGRTIEFEAKGGPGKVVLEGKTHADKGLKCNDCHTKVFMMKKGSAKMTMADINAGMYCGTCHNGEKAFKSSDKANCAKCHKKQAE